MPPEKARKYRRRRSICIFEIQQFVWKPRVCECVCVWVCVGMFVAERGDMDCVYVSMCFFSGR